MGVATDEREARQRWHRALADAGATGERSAADAALDDLLARYAEPHRRYHGVAHVRSVTDRVDELLEGIAPGAAAGPGTGPLPGDRSLRAAVLLAAWFHDAVYDPRSGTNEADSATLAVAQLARLGVPGPVADRVAALVLATRAHEAVDAATAVLLDADLAVLGADPAAYERYRQGVRAEYQHVDDAGWRAGRAQVLERLLALPSLFRTAVGRGAEAQARANLRAERASLSSRP